MIVDCAHYLDGSRQSDRTISLEEAAMQCRQGGFVWLGLFEPSGEELDEVRESFDLHELAVDDAKTFHLRPKVEEYESGVQLVILRTARYNHDQDEVDFGEISIFVGPNSREVGPETTTAQSFPGNAIGTATVARCNPLGSVNSVCVRWPPSADLIALVRSGPSL